MMQNELRWALLAIGVALIILVVVGVKIKRTRQAGLKEFEDASWHPEEDVLVDSDAHPNDVLDDLPNLEDVKAYNPHLDVDTAQGEPVAHVRDGVPPVTQDVPTLAIKDTSPAGTTDDIPVVSHVADVLEETAATSHTSFESASGLAADHRMGGVPVVNASHTTDDIAPSVAPEFLKKGQDQDFSEHAMPPYRVKDALPDLEDGSHTSYHYQAAVSDEMREDGLDVAAALQGLENTHRQDEPAKGEQTSLLFDDEFENQVKKHLEKREAEKKQSPANSVAPTSKTPDKTPEPRYSTVETYEGAQTQDKNKQKPSDAFKPRYSTVKNLNQDEPAKPEPPAQENVAAAPQSVAATVADAKEPEVIILHIKATDSIGFYGPQIAKTLGDIGMKFGDMGIYHYQSSGQRILSVSNIVKPGYFEPKKFSQFTTPGLSVFASVYPDSDMDFVKEVIEKSAQYIRAQLKGVLYDMNHQRIDHLASYISTQMDDIQTIFNEA